MENDIQIERYTTPTVEAYKIDGKHIGTINNEHEFNKFRLQMVIKRATSQYYFMWNDIKITVDAKGNMSSFPVGLYDQVQRDLLAIMKEVQKQQWKED